MTLSLIITREEAHGNLQKYRAGVGTGGAGQKPVLRLPDLHVSDRTVYQLRVQLLLHARPTMPDL